MSSEILLRFASALGIIFLGVGGYWLLNKRLLVRVRKNVNSLFNPLPNKPTIVYFTTPDCATCKTFQLTALEKLTKLLG